MDKHKQETISNPDGRKTGPFSQGVPNHPKAKSDPVKLEKIFGASLDVVWGAWSTPELVRQWWGPEGFHCPEAHIDFRKGGRYHFAMESPEGEVVWSGGEYQDLAPRKRIVCTDRFETENGKPVPASFYKMPGDWPEECTITLTFEERNGKTLLRLLHEGIPNSMHDDCVRGWGSSLEKMKRLVESH